MGSAADAEAAAKQQASARRTTEHINLGMCRGCTILPPKGFGMPVASEIVPQAVGPIFFTRAYLIRAILPVLFHLIIGRFARDDDVVDVAFAQAGGSDA